MRRITLTVLTEDDSLDPADLVRSLRASLDAREERSRVEWDEDEVQMLGYAQTGWTFHLIDGRGKLSPFSYDVSLCGVSVVSDHVATTRQPVCRNCQRVARARK